MRTPEQIAEIMAWTDALYGGAYHQGVGRLVIAGPFGARLHCCLGVKCEITPGVVMDANGLDGPGYCFEDFTDSFRLPTSLAKRLDMHDSGELYNPDGTRLLSRKGVPTSLVSMNDDGFTFPQIADVIRYNGGELLARYY